MGRFLSLKMSFLLAIKNNMIVFKAKTFLSKPFFTDIYIDLISLALLWVYAIYYWQSNLRYVIGLVVSIVSVTLWIVSRVQLGKAFSTFPKAKYLVSAGIYAKIRHPMYLFSTLSLLGVYIATENVYIGFILISLICVQLFRVYKENILLQKTFGEEYTAYVKKVWF